MSPKTALPDLSKSDLDLMKVLWRRGRSSAREVHEEVAKPFGWAYSTTRTTLDRMVKKDLLAKEEFHGLNLYRPRISRPVGLASRVRDFAERVVELHWAPVVSLFAQSESLSPEEIAELTALLEAEEGE